MLITFDDNKNTSFQTLLDKNIKLNGKNLLFINQKKAINLAGIIGNKYTSCSAETTSVIVECAFFKPENNIGKTIEYDIESDAAYKFERGVVKCHDYVLKIS